MVMKMMGLESASAFSTTGGFTSGGRLNNAPETLSRTSLAAASRFTPNSNSTVMELRPSRLTDVSVRIPGTPLMASSSGSVICDSMTSAFATTYDVFTVTTGGSTLGNSRTPKKLKPINPNRIMTNDITMASTGLLILTVDKLAINVIYNFLNYFLLLSPLLH